MRLPLRSPLAFFRALSAPFIACLTACAFALGVSAPVHAAEEPVIKPPPFWKGFKQIGDTGGTDVRVRSWVPEADTPADWHEAFNVYVFTPPPPGDPTGAILAYMQQVAEHACGALAVDLGQVRPDPDPALPGASTRYAQMFCPNAAGNARSRVDVLKLVATRQAVTVFLMMRQAQPFVLNLPQPAAFKTPEEAAAHDAWLAQATKYLREVARVCEHHTFSKDSCSQ